MGICDICFENENSVTLSCNHNLCHKCVNHVSKCPFCRRDILRVNYIMKDLMFGYNLVDPESDFSMKECCTFANDFFHVSKKYYSKYRKIKIKSNNFDLYNPVVIDGSRCETSGKYEFSN